MTQAYLFFYTDSRYVHKFLTLYVPPQQSPDFFFCKWQNAMFGMEENRKKSDVFLSPIAKNI